MEKSKTVNLKKKFIKCKVGIEKNIFSVIMND